MSGTLDIEGMLSQAAQGKFQPGGAQAAPSFPITPVRPVPGETLPSGMNISDEDYQKLMANKPPPPAAAMPAAPVSSPGDNAVPQSFDVEGALQQAKLGQLKYTPPPPTGSTMPGIASNFAAGANRQIFGGLGAPVDLATGAINLGARGINAMTGANIPPIQNPVGGSDWLQSQFGKVSVDPRTVQPQGEAERVAGAVGGGVASLPMMALGAAGAGAAIPAGAAPVTAGALQSVRTMPIVPALAPVAGGAAIGQGAEDVTPEPFKPLANVAGNVAGGVGLGGLQQALGAALRPVGRVAGGMGLGPKTSFGGVSVTPQQADIVAQRTGQALGPEGYDLLQAAQPNAVPDYRPTLAQIAQTPGAVSLEKSFRPRCAVHRTRRRAERSADRRGHRHGRAR